MANRNLNTVRQNVQSLNSAKQFRNVAATEMLADLWMLPALSPGLPGSEPGSTSTVDTTASIRVGRSAASQHQPGNRAFLRNCLRQSRRSIAKTTVSKRRSIAMDGPALSDRCSFHRHSAGHDYRSHDRRDEKRITDMGYRPQAGLAASQSNGK
jgi:hypothetical protein